MKLLLGGGMFYHSPLPPLYNLFDKQVMSQEKTLDSTALKVDKNNHSERGNNRKRRWALKNMRTASYFSVAINMMFEEESIGSTFPMHELSSIVIPFLPWTTFSLRKG